MKRHSLFWDWYARCYDGLLETLPYRWLLEQAADFLPVGTRVLLDAGCGTGNLLRTIRARHPTICLHGLDFSQAMLRRAATKVPGAELRQADLNATLPYPDRCFDAVTCINVLYAVARPEQTLAELRRVLKPRGVLIASSPLPHPGISPIIRAHAAEAGWKNTALLLARMIGLGLFNSLIVGRGRSYHFMDHKSVHQLLGCAGTGRTYARQNWFACVMKDGDASWAVCPKVSRGSSRSPFPLSG